MLASGFLDESSIAGTSIQQDGASTIGNERRGDVAKTKQNASRVHSKRATRAPVVSSHHTFYKDFYTNDDQPSCRNAIDTLERQRPLVSIGEGSYGTVFKSNTV